MFAGHVVHELARVVGHEDSGEGAEGQVGCPLPGTLLVEEGTVGIETVGGDAFEQRGLLGGQQR